MIITVFYLVTSLFLLGWAGKQSVNYALKTAQALHIDTLFVGSTLVAITTGLPELLVALNTIIRNVPKLSAGDIIGSNFIDITLVLGLPTIFFDAIYFDSYYNKIIFSNQRYLFFLTFFIMAFVLYIGFINRFTGILLVILYIVNLYILFRLSQHKNHMLVSHTNSIPSTPHAIAGLFFFTLLLIIAAHVTVTSSLAIIEYLQWPVSHIGATILALGTSLPELTVNWHAVRQKEYALALGNSFGSIFQQGTLILGFLGIFAKHTIMLTHILLITRIYCLPIQRLPMPAS